MSNLSLMRGQKGNRRQHNMKVVADAKSQVLTSRNLYFQVIIISMINCHATTETSDLKCFSLSAHILAFSSVALMIFNLSFSSSSLVMMEPSFLLLRVLASEMRVQTSR
mmetsp:Transcript_14361/g.30711  ORF Transcript_14361/g.30711 Transcript_14361/m.30711 type:complete len:109 (+) Transcript_14361:156-482(+)